MEPALIFALMLTALLLIAAWLDGTRYVIPNWLNGFILLLYPAMLLTVPGAAQVPWLDGLYAFLLLFTIGYLLHFFNILGGGDVKLLCALALWMGLSRPMLDFVLYTALLGGALTLFLLTVRPLTAYVAARLDWPAARIPRVLSHKEPVPYGIAIGAAFLILLWQGEVPGLQAVKAGVSSLL